MRGEAKLGAHFGVVGKPTSDFLISVHWSYFGCLEQFSHKSTEYSENTWFFRIVYCGAIQIVNRSRLRDIPKQYTPKQTRSRTFIWARTKAVRSTVRLQHVWLIFAWYIHTNTHTHTHTHTHITTTLQRSPIIESRVRKKLQYCCCCWWTLF